METLSGFLNLNEMPCPFLFENNYLYIYCKNGEAKSYLDKTLSHEGGVKKPIPNRLEGQSNNNKPIVFYIDGVG